MSSHIGNQDIEEDEDTVKKKSLVKEIRRYHKLMELQARSMPLLCDVLLGMMRVLASVQEILDDDPEQDLSSEDFYRG